MSDYDKIIHFCIKWLNYGFGIMSENEGEGEVACKIYTIIFVEAYAYVCLDIQTVGKNFKLGGNVKKMSRLF